MVQQWWSSELWDDSAAVAARVDALVSAGSVVVVNAQVLPAARTPRQAVISQRACGTEPRAGGVEQFCRFRQSRVRFRGPAVIGGEQTTQYCATRSRHHGLQQQGIGRSEQTARLGTPLLSRADL